MTTPDWFGARRYGLFVHMSIASVPGFAPLHEYTEWYWSHLSETPLDDVILHPAPMPEVQAWHDEHHPGMAYDDFIPSLRMEHWDADAVADLAVDAGMGYVVQTSKHHDGYCFFDSALTDRTTVRSGPGRDPVGELADASRRAGLTFGLYYSLLDWSHPDYGGDAYVSDYLHPQVAELVDRYGPSVLWGDGHWGRSPAYWRSDEIVEAYRAAMGSEGAVNDRWGASSEDFLTFEYETPDEPPGRPFEVTRGVAYSFGWSRVERQDDHLTPSALVALLTETVAKGGNLLLNVGPRPDGVVPESQVAVLGEAGRWVRAEDGAISGSEPFDVWGDATTRYTVSPSPDGLVHLNAIDLTGAPRPRFAALVPDRYELVGEDGDGGGDGATQDRGGVVSPRPPGGEASLAPVHRLTLRRQDAGRVVARPPGRGARIAERSFPTVGRALAAAAAGEVVEVAEGRHGPDAEGYPLVVPAGVTLRGPADAVLDAGRGATVGSAATAGAAATLPAVVLLAGHGAAVVGLTVTGAPQEVFFLPPVAVRADGIDDVVVEACTLVRGSVVVRGGRGARVVGNRLDGASVWLVGTTDAEVADNRQGGNRWGVGVHVEGGSGARVVDNEVADDLAGVRVAGAEGVVVTGNRVRARWWGIHVEDSTGAAVTGNEVVRTMRAVCLTGGAGHRVAGNRLSGCDSAVLLEGATTGATLVDNLVEDCRLGVFAWDAPGLEERANVVLRPREVG